MTDPRQAWHKGAYCEVVDIKALHERFWRWLWVLVDIHTGSHAVVLGDCACIELLDHFASIQITAADL